MDDILLFQILPRLSARSIGRFMCVCKQWHSFLTTPEFTKMHLHHVNNENRPKVIALSAAGPSSNFQTMDCETPEVGFSGKRSLPFEIKNNKMRILSSLNGLVCVLTMPNSSNYLDIVLWNPLTGEYKRLSKDNSHGNTFDIGARAYGLYYNSCDDDYKLLRVTESSDAYIYSWKSESWRKAKSRVDSLLEIWNSNCLVNEKLYFVAQGTQGGGSHLSSMIIRFDTKTEMLTEIATPSSTAVCFNVTVVGGCLHLCVVSKIDRGKLELWKMDGDGDGEWTKVIHYPMLPSACQPWHLMKNGNWLLLYGREVAVYKVNGKKAKMAIKHSLDTTMRLLNGKFVETLVSLK